MFKVYEVFGAQNPALVGSSSSSPVACLEPHGAGTDLHDGRVLMERWDWEMGAILMIQAFPPFILYKLTINTSQKPWWSWFSPWLVGCLRFVSHIMVAFHLPSAQVGMLPRRPALLRGLWPWQFGQRRPLGLCFHRSARELSWCNKSIT